MRSGQCEAEKKTIKMKTILDFYAQNVFFRLIYGLTLQATSSSKSFNPRDRLKRKMQILLNKQCKWTEATIESRFILLKIFFSSTDKADKLAEIEKTERQVQQQQEREDEMRELALRLRRKYTSLDLLRFFFY